MKALDYWIEKITLWELESETKSFAFFIHPEDWAILKAEIKDLYYIKQDGSYIMITKKEVQVF